MMKYKLLVLYISVTQFASGSENDSGEVFSQAKHHRHSKRGIYGHGMDRNEICPKECLCLSEIQVGKNYMKALGKRMKSLKSLEKDELSQLMNKQLKWLDEYSQSIDI